MIFDILLNETTGDLVNSGGDFRTGDATNQDLYALVISAPGHFKEFPQVGAAIYTYLNGTATAADIERAIRVQLQADIFPNPLVNATSLTNIIINSINVKLK